MRSRSGSCSVVVSGFPFSFPCAPADVAANLILLAIIARRAMWQGSWEGGGMLWNALLHRCVELVADGLTLWRGAQLAIDTTLVSPLRRDGSARNRAANIDGAALDAARLRKEKTYPELCGERGRARLVVLAAEVGGL